MSDSLSERQENSGTSIDTTGKFKAGKTLFKYYFSYYKENILDNLECRQGIIQGNHFGFLHCSKMAWQWLYIYFWRAFVCLLQCS